LTLIIDAAPLVALADATEPKRDAIRAILADEPGALAIPTPITAEIDYLLILSLGTSGTPRRKAVAAIQRSALCSRASAWPVASQSARSRTQTSSEVPGMGRLGQYKPRHPSPL